MGTSESLYWALAQTIRFYLGAVERPVTLTGISLEQEVSEDWVSHLEPTPIMGFVFERMSHADISVITDRFMQQVWPVMADFLEEVPVLEVG